jgi:predicted component of type VI protein secretion system
MPNQSFGSIDMTESKLMTMRSANHKAEVIEVEVQRRTNQTEFEKADYQTFNETAKNLHSHQHVN